MQTTSAAVSVTVNTGVAQAYYIHTDQLDTPRVVTDTGGNVVWKWDNADPFGANMANENPNGAGTFSFNLRFPGQYYDKETNLHYNVNRDYDPAIGRYVQSDPIGLGGGINTYTYVDGDPLSYVDLFGLKVLNPNGFPVSPDVMNALWEFNRLIGCNKDIVITGGDRPKDSKIGSGSNSTHAQHIAADIYVPGQPNLETANQADISGLFGGVGWYEEGCRGPKNEGPHTHVDMRKNGPARWGHPKKGPTMHGYFPKHEVKLNSSDCGCQQ